MPEQQERRSFDKHFNVSAVKLVLESGRSVESISSDFGLSKNTFLIGRRIT